MSFPYAPVTSLPHRNSSISLNEEVRLYSSPKERERFENLAEIYSIIVSLDHLEKAFIKDSVSQSDYHSICSRLLNQYTAILKNDDIKSEFKDLDTFKQRYGLDCTLASQRLALGIPATVERPNFEISANHNSAANGSRDTETPPPGGPGGSGGTGGGASNSRAVAEATGNFITCMDALKLNYSATDQLHPLLGDLMTSLSKVTSQDFAGRDKIVSWLITLNSMKATESISDDQSRQLLFDLDNAYKGFFSNLD